MATEDQLAAEARERPRAAVLAGIAALLTMAGAVIGYVPGSAPSNLPAYLLFFHAHRVVFTISAVCAALGFVAIAFVLDFLYRATRARNPSIPKQLRPLPFIGGFGFALFTCVAQGVLVVKTGHFAAHGTQTYAEAKRAYGYEVPVLLGPVAQLVLALAIVMLSLNAMRVGLLTRFLGYLGMFSAALIVLPLVPVPLVQAYWLGMLAALFLGRSPSGMPPAWDSGEAVAWPSSQEMREARVRAAEERRGGGGAPVAGELVEGASGNGPSSASRRKRKKRK
jgi:hypothetical protein